MLKVLAERSSSYCLYSSLLPQEHLHWKTFKVFLPSQFGKKKIMLPELRKTFWTHSIYHVCGCVRVCLHGRRGRRRGKYFQLADRFSSGWKRHLKSMEPGWVTTAGDLAQAAVMCRAVVWGKLNIAVQKEKLKEMFGSQTCFFHVWRTAVQLQGAMPANSSDMCFSLSFVGQITTINFSECLWWV